LSCAHWLNWKCGVGLNAAREKVRVARALEDLPRIAAAFAAGELSYSKVRAMTRVATPESEEYLLMIARHGTASHLERLVRGYRRMKRIEETAQANGAHAMREVTWYWDDDGSLVFKARLPPERGALVVKALAAAEQALRETVRRAWTLPRKRASRAGTAGRWIWTWRWTGCCSAIARRRPSSMSHRDPISTSNLAEHLALTASLDPPGSPITGSYPLRGQRLAALRGRRRGV